MRKSFSARYGIIKVVKYIFCWLEPLAWLAYKRIPKPKGISQQARIWLRCATTKENQPAFLLYGLVEPMEDITEEKVY